MPVSTVKHKHANEIIARGAVCSGAPHPPSLVSTAPLTRKLQRRRPYRRREELQGSSAPTSPMRSCGSSAFPPILCPPSLFAYALFLGFGKEALHPHLKKVGGLVLIVSSAVLFGLQGRHRAPSQRRASVRRPSAVRFPLSPPGVSVTGSYIITVTAIVSPHAPHPVLAARRPGVDTQRLRQAHGADRDHGCPYRAGAEKAREAKLRPVQPKEPPKIVDTQREAACMREQKEKEKKPAKPVQSSFGFMEGKGDIRFLLPTCSIPSPPAVKRVTKEDMLAQSALLSRKFMDFDIQGRVVQVYPGPVVTMFEFEPAPGVKVSKIVNLSGRPGPCHEGGERAHRGASAGQGRRGHRGAEQHPGDGVLPGDLWNRPVSVQQIPAQDPLGKDIFGVPVVTTIEKMPHLLVAGATGPGKSVAINSVILALLYNARPNEVKLVLVDPKNAGASLYNDIPHLLSPVVTQLSARPRRSGRSWAEMERRYLAARREGVEEHRVLQQDRARGGAAPYIVVIIDELADLMMTVQREVEDSIMRLARWARAAGIHLIVATQRPSVDVITGLHQGQSAGEDILPGLVQDGLAHYPRRPTGLRTS